MKKIFLLLSFILIVILGYSQVIIGGALSTTGTLSVNGTGASSVSGSVTIGTTSTDQTAIYKDSISIINGTVRNTNYASADTFYLGYKSTKPVKIGASSLIVDNDGSISIPSRLFYWSPPHSNNHFGDSAIVISGGTNVQVTNIYDSLYSAYECSWVQCLRGDTVKILYKGGYNVPVNIGGSGGNGADWEIRVAKKSGASITYTKDAIVFSTDGATNYKGGGFTFYVECLANDKLWVVLSRIGGSGDYTARTGSFNPYSLYLEK